MNYGKINKYDIANGIGVRVSIFVSGCNIHCPGCHNKDAQNFSYGKPLTIKVIQDIIEALRPDYISGLSILGGEPLDPNNVESVADLVKKVKSEISYKDIWLWSGYTIDSLVKRAKSSTALQYILNSIDVLIDGAYIEDKRNISLQFRGSSNQRILLLNDAAIKHDYDGFIKDYIEWKGDLNCD